MLLQPEAQAKETLDDGERWSRLCPGGSEPLSSQGASQMHQEPKEMELREYLMHLKTPRVD